MPTLTRRAARWVATHALAATAAAVVLLGAAGGGLGYEIAGQHSSAASIPAAPGSQAAVAAPSKPAAAAAANRGTQLLERGLQMLATETGQTVEQVRSQLMAGKSIDDIAGSKAAGIEAAIVAQITKLADKAVAAKKITADQEAAGLATVKSRISGLMAEPGTQLVKDLRQLVQVLHNHLKGGAVPAAPPTPAG